MGSNAIVYVDETVGQGKLRLRQKVWKKRVRNLLFSLFSRGQGRLVQWVRPAVR